ncbi:MAG: histidine kinase dimerization/phospho-acceptor domain-containing protein, partial [Myxococcota bacterium]|nr:histidine kinase dimerization/phospho-acceptor domain-containing protein [Myxococcota bacterium]
MSDSPDVVRLILVGDAAVPDGLAEVAMVRVADASEALEAAVDTLCPLVAADAQTLATLGEGVGWLKLLTSSSPPAGLPDGVVGALPLWDEGATSLAIEATLAMRSRLLAAKAEVARTEAEREAFVHAVSHDLKGPLQGIIGLAGLLMEQSGVRVFPEVAAYAQRIEDDADRLAAMVSALTRYARLGRPALARTNVALEPLVN